ncbi:MAG TPA: lytic murein transglycosylase B [Thiotrichales bacterium]|nr:lytic murein transglycosylase B [Thiotrichales bacterium]
MIRTILLVLLLIPPLHASATEMDREALNRFIDEVSSRHQIPRGELEALFERVRFRDEIIRAISNPAEARPWYQYRPIFLTEERVAGGVAFWESNRQLLEKAEAAYGVPAEIIVAILGVETRYGRYKGRHRVLESLATLAFGYPKRARFFRRELEEFILLAREEGMDPLALKGSYAGAMGGPQFISSSYRRYAVDFDGDGQRNLFASTADMIGSVAHYFRRHGWQPGQPVASRSHVEGDGYRELVGQGLKPRYTVAQFRERQVIPEDPLPAEALATLVELELEEGHEYWLGLQNFYVITRYNHSPLYAMAVWLLSQEIAARRGS